MWDVTNIPGRRDARRLDVLPRISTSSELLFRCAATRRRSGDQFNRPTVVRHRHRSRNIPSTPSYAKSLVETAGGSICSRPSLQIGCPDTRNAVPHCLFADVRASQDKTVTLPSSSGRSLGVYLVTCKMSVQCMRSTVDLVNRAIPRDLQHPPRPSPSPTPTIRQAIPADVWYCADQDRPVGPLTFEGLLEKLVTLSNSADALVWCSKFSGWKRAADVSELKAHVLVPPALAVPTCSWTGA